MEGINKVKALRIDSHSHIKGLGLDENGIALQCSSGFVGQTVAREAAGLVIDMIRRGKLQGRAVLLVGQPGTGKTAIAMAIARELGNNIPFYPMAGSEVYSSKIKKEEALATNFWKAIGLKVEDKMNVLGGEVTFLDIERNDDFERYYSRNEVLIGVKTATDEVVVPLEPHFGKCLRKANVKVGDVVCIQVYYDLVKRLGTSSRFAEGVDDGNEKICVPLPKGKCRRWEKIDFETNLYDFCVREAQFEINPLDQVTIPDRSSIRYGERDLINKVKEYIDQGIAQLVPGVLFIDEVHMLDTECFSYLRKALESDVSPTVIFATNKGKCSIRGTPDNVATHGIPPDLLDRLIIIKTMPYSKEEIQQIIYLRAQIEGLQIDKEALEKLSEIGASSTLRYAIQLLVPASTLAQANGNEKIGIDEIQETNKLFLDDFPAMHNASFFDS